MEAVWVALIVAVSGLLGQWLLKWQDYRRQDEVARKLLIANERVANSTLLTNNKLDVIHTLVNSNMTAAMQSELDATVRELAMMREVIGLNRNAGREPTELTLAAINVTEDRVNELKAQLQTRLEQTTIDPNKDVLHR